MLRTQIPLTLCPVCTSPEIACGPLFHKQVVQNGGFRDKRRKLVVIIDEAHMVDQWSKFRVQYSKIKFLRYRLPNSTKFIGMSGTLDDETRRKVIENAGFRRPVFLNTSIDRPEIHIELRRDTSSRHSFSGLRFLFPDELPSERPHEAFTAAQKLPKTMIFFDSKRDQRLALLLCRKWLEDAGLENHEAKRIVGIYHAGIRESEKQTIRTAFLPADSETRVMLVTEAMGMGVEIAAIEVVIQYGAKQILRDRSSFKTLVQRMGRAARRKGEKGWFIWLLPYWFFASPDILARDRANYQPTNLGDIATIQPQSQKIKLKKSDARQYAALDPIYKRLTLECSRRVIGDFFTPEESGLKHRTWPINERCCSYCDQRKAQSNSYPPRCDLSVAEYPEIVKTIQQLNAEDCQFDRALMLHLPADYTPASTPHQFGPVWTALLQWRKDKLADIKQKYTGELAYAPDMLGESSIMPDEVMRKIAQMNNFLNEELGPKFLAYFAADWAIRDEVIDPEQDAERTFGDEALDIVRRHCQIVFPSTREAKRFQTESKVLERYGLALKDERRQQWNNRQQRCSARYGPVIPLSAMPGDIINQQFAPRPKKTKPKLPAPQENEDLGDSQTDAESVC